MKERLGIIYDFEDLEQLKNILLNDELHNQMKELKINCLKCSERYRKEIAIKNVVKEI